MTIVLFIFYQKINNSNKFLYHRMSNAQTLVYQNDKYIFNITATRSSLPSWDLLCYGRYLKLFA